MDELIKVEKDIPLDIQNNAYLNVYRNNGRTIHNIGLQYAKFIPELPKWAINKYSEKGDVILDPFVGSGTTLVECGLNDRNSFGVDYNPLSRLISKVKTTILNKDSLRKDTSKLIRLIGSDLQSDYELPDFSNRDFWFDLEVSKALAVIKNNIKSIRNTDNRDFFMVCFSVLVRRVSHSAQAMILPAKRKKFNEEKKLSRKDVAKNFQKIVSNYTALILDFSSKADKSVSARIVGFDARSLKDTGDVDMVITSPPYINAIDYTWANKFRLHWLDFVKTNTDRLNLYGKEIGTERISKKEYEVIGKTGYKQIDKKIKQAYESDVPQAKLRSRVVYKYFMDMKQHFREAYKVLDSGSYYCLVMGDNRICKVDISTADFLSIIMQDIGFEKSFQFQIILKNRMLNIPRNVDWANDIEYDRMMVFKR